MFKRHYAIFLADDESIEYGITYHREAIRDYMVKTGTLNHNWTPEESYNYVLENGKKEDADRIYDLHNGVLDREVYGASSKSLSEALVRLAEGMRRTGLDVT